MAAEKYEPRKRKDGGAYRAAGAIETRQRADGRSYYRLAASLPRGRDGKRRYLKQTLEPGISKRDAAKLLAKLVAKADSMNPDDPSFVILEVFWDRYWRAKSPILSPYTRAGYQRDWNLRIKPHLADYTLAELEAEPSIVADWLATLAESGRADGGPLAYNSVRHARTTLCAVLSTAAEWRIITRPHAAEIAKVPGEAPVEPDRTPDLALLGMLVAELAGEDFELFAFERVCSTLGPRRGEAAALRISDVLDDAVVFDEAVKMERLPPKKGERRPRRGSKVAHITIGATKTRQRRTVAADDETIAVLRSWIMRKRTLAAECGVALAGDALLFSEDVEGRLPAHPDRWSRMWRRHQERHGVTGIRQHDLRHAVGGVLASLGLPLTAIAEILGHARVTTTARYSHTKAGQQAAGLVAGVLAQAATDAEREAG
jgi:integrase